MECKDIVHRTHHELVSVSILRRRCFNRTRNEKGENTLDTVVVVAAADESNMLGK